MSVVVQCEGRTLASSLAPAGFVDGLAEVTVAGLTPGNPHTLRCRCDVEDPDVDPEALWWPPVAVTTLSPAALEVCMCAAHWGWGQWEGVFLRSRRHHHSRALPPWLSSDTASGDVVAWCVVVSAVV